MLKRFFLFSVSFIFMGSIMNEIAQADKDIEKEYEEREKAIDKAWEKREKAVEKEWQELEKMIDESWEQYSKALLKSWEEEKDTSGVLCDIKLGGDAASIFKSTIDFRNDTLLVIAKAFAKSKEAAKKKAVELAKKKAHQTFKNLNMRKDYSLERAMKDTKIEAPKKPPEFREESKEVTKFKDGGYQATVVLKKPMMDPSITKTAKALEKKEKIKTAGYGGSTSGISTYTGLIIDARGLDFETCMAPSIVNSKGEELYGPLVVDENQAVKKGMVIWRTSVTDAKKSIKRVGGKPFVVKAINTDGNYKLVVGERDAKNIYLANQKSGFLDKANVAIVL